MFSEDPTSPGLRLPVQHPEVGRPFVWRPLRRVAVDLWQSRNPDEAMLPHMALSLGRSLRLVLCERRNDQVTPAHQSRLGRIGLSPERHWAECRRGLTVQWRRVAPGVFITDVGDGLDAARLMLSEDIKALGFAGPPVAVVPTPGRAFVADGASLHALRDMLTRAVAAASRSQRVLSLLPMQWLDGAWRDAELPEALGALHDEIRAITRWHEWLDHCRAGTSETLGHAALMGPEVRLQAVWVKGTSVTLPICQDVVLVDPQLDGPERLSIVDMGQLCAVLPCTGPDDPTGTLRPFKGDSFPTQRERAFLVKARRWALDVNRPVLAAEGDPFADAGDVLPAFEGDALVAIRPDFSTAVLTRDEWLAATAHWPEEDRARLGMHLVAAELLGDVGWRESLIENSPLVQVPTEAERLRLLGNEVLQSLQRHLTPEGAPAEAERQVRLRRGAALLPEVFVPGASGGETGPWGLALRLTRAAQTGRLPFDDESLSAAVKSSLVGIALGTLEGALLGALEPRLHGVMTIRRQGLPASALVCLPAALHRLGLEGEWWVAAPTLDTLLMVRPGSARALEALLQEATRTLEHVRALDEALSERVMLLRDGTWQALELAPGDSGHEWLVEYASRVRMLRVQAALLGRRGTLGRA